MNKNFIISVISFFLAYIKYLFLTGSVIFSLVVLLFVLSELAPDFSFGFLSYFSFLDQAYGTGTFNMGIPEVMKIFSLISLVVMFASYVLRLALKKLFNIVYEISLKFKIVFFVTFITLAYVIAVTLVKIDTALDSLFYNVFAVFYVLNLISLALYFLVDALLKKLTTYKIFQTSLDN